MSDLGFNVNKGFSMAEDDIRLSDAALVFVVHYLKAHDNSLGIRFSVKNAGCSGMMYDVLPLEVVAEDDFVFEFGDGLKVVVDKVSFPYVKGTLIDLKKEGLNEKLVFLNPKAENACGCGESFNVKDS